MTMFVTSYKGMPINGSMYGEHTWVLSNTSEALANFVREATSELILRMADGNTGFNGTFPKEEPISKRGHGKASRKKSAEIYHLLQAERRNLSNANLYTYC